MRAAVASGAGFLLAVLWFDLMFDVQVLRLRGAASDDVAEEVLTSIAAYYRRVTTAARPMNRLVAVAMAATIVVVALEAVDGGWRGWVSVPLVLLPVGVAGAVTVPRAVRLGARRDPPATQRALASSIFGQHLFCLGSIAALLAVQLIG